MSGMTMQDAMMTAICISDTPLINEKIRAVRHRMTLAWGIRMITAELDLLQTYPSPFIPEIILRTEQIKISPQQMKMSARDESPATFLSVSINGIRIRLPMPETIIMILETVKKTLLAVPIKTPLKIILNLL